MSEKPKEEFEDEEPDELEEAAEDLDVDQLMRDSRAAPAEPLVRLLQRNDVGIDLVQDVENALRIAPPVGADGLAHIIAGDGDRRGHDCGNPAPATAVP